MHNRGHVMHPLLALIHFGEFSEEDLIHGYWTGYICVIVISFLVQVTEFDSRSSSAFAESRYNRS